MSRLPSYVPLSRGIRDYLGIYSGNAIKVYCWLLTGAEWREGPDKECWMGSLRSIQAGTTLSPKTLNKALVELSIGVFKSSGSAPPFIEITEEQGNTRGKRLRIMILKAKLSARDFHRVIDDVRKKVEASGIDKPIPGPLGDLIKGLAARLEIPK